MLSNIQTPSFRVTDIPKKGKVLVATRKICRGELVVAEETLFTAETPDVCTDLSVFQQPKESNFCRLPTLILQCIQPYPQFFAHALPLGCGSTVGGLFPTIARINHSCNPNVHHSWNSATRRIEEGEELRTSYIELFQKREQRQRELNDTFKFNCYCSACQVPDPTVSDQRRSRISELGQLILYTAERRPRKALKLVQERVKLMDDEAIADPSNKARTFYDPSTKSVQRTRVMIWQRNMLRWRMYPIWWRRDQTIQHPRGRCLASRRIRVRIR